jgi:hypothetical protein
VIKTEIEKIKYAYSLFSSSPNVQYIGAWKIILKIFWNSRKALTLKKLAGSVSCPALGLLFG